MKTYAMLICVILISRNCFAIHGKFSGGIAGCLDVSLQRNVDPLLEEIDLKDRKDLDEAAYKLICEHKHLWREQGAATEEYCDWWFKRLEEVNEFHVELWSRQLLRSES